MQKKKGEKVYLKKEKKNLNAMQFKETVYNSYDTVRNDKKTTRYDNHSIRYSTVRYDVIRHDTVVRYEQ